MEVLGEELADNPVKEIYSSHSSEEEKLHCCADRFVSHPVSSWMVLVWVLYYHGEMAAAKKAKTFIQQQGE